METASSISKVHAMTVCSGQYLTDLDGWLCMQVENEDLIFTLETLVERFDEEMAPYAVGLTQHLAAAFWRMQVLPSRIALHL